MKQNIYVPRRSRASQLDYKRINFAYAFVVILALCVFVPRHGSAQTASNSPQPISSVRDLDRSAEGDWFFELALFKDGPARLLLARVKRRSPDILPEQAESEVVRVDAVLVNDRGDPDIDGAFGVSVRGVFFADRRLASARALRSATGEDLVVDESLNNSPYPVTADDAFDNVVVGQDNNGQLNQSAGVFTIAGNLDIGRGPGTTGTYNLTGGSVSSTLTYLGIDGAGVFTQSDGTHTVGDTLFLGLGEGSSGSYTLNGGALATGITVVGSAGAGTFTQTGGTHTVMNDLVIGGNGGAGSYDLSGGVLHTGNVFIGFGSSGMFNQSGGTFSAAEVEIGSSAPGSFTLSGGSFTTNGSAFFLGRTPDGNGTFTLSGSGSIITGAAFIGVDGMGAIVQSGGTFSAAEVQVGYSSIGSFNLSGGTFTTDGNALVLGLNQTGNGTLTLSGSGSITTGDAFIGVDGTGAVVQSGGTFSNAGTTLFIANGLGSTGSFNLSGDGTLTTGNTEVGFGGTGTFAQSGGTHAITGSLALGRAVGADGAYTLSGGALSAETVFVGINSAGAFAHSGGTHTISDALTLGLSDGSTGSYALGGTGILSTGNTRVGYEGSGTFTQNGGDHMVDGALVLGFNVTGDGTYSLSDGTLSTIASYVGLSGTGSFTQTGGSHTTSGGTLFIGQDAGSTGSYTLSRGTLSTGDVLVGNQGTGSFIQSGGSFTTNDRVLVLGYLPGGGGTYDLSGGTLTTRVTQVSDDKNTSIFTQSGGIHTTQALALTGYSTESRGIYNLDGGTLNVAQIYSGDNNVNGISTFNFNGGLLQASARDNPGSNYDSYNFMSGQIANVRNGGAIIDSNGYNVTVAQSITHSPMAGDNPVDGGLTKRGAGVLTLIEQNTFTGATTINAGTLRLNTSSGQALANTASITVNNGGTLLLDHSHQVNNIAPMTLNANSGPASGATVAFNTNGLSETLGALTLTSTSVIDLGSGASMLLFADSSANAWTGTLAIWNWSGLPITGGGIDQLFFGNSIAGVTPAQLTEIQFYSDSGLTSLGLATYATGFNGEVVPDGIVPVPEPAPIAAAVFLVGAIAWHERKRFFARARSV